MKPNDVMPVPCATWVDKLAAQPGDLTTEERAALASHILTCPSCAAVQAVYSTMDASILALPPVAPLAELPYIYGMAGESGAGEDRHKAPPSALHPPLVPTGRRRTTKTVPDRQRSHRWMRIVSGLAAVLVVGALLGGFLLLFNAHHAQVGGNAGGQTIFTLSDESDGTVYALNQGDGSIEWQYSIHSKLTGALVASNDTLYVGAYDRYVYALRKSDGTLLWSSPATSEDATAPTFVDKTAVYGSSLTTIFALSIKDGHLLWSHQSPRCNTCVATFVATGNGTLYAYMDG